MPDEIHEGGDPACWAHLFDDDDSDAEAPDDTADDEGGVIGWDS